jgi:hypothetical protein
MTNYQYLYCAACGTRRTGHGYQCSVCGGLLRHNTPSVKRATPATLTPTVRWQAPVQEPARTPEREPVLA